MESDEAVLLLSHCYYCCWGRHALDVANFVVAVVVVDAVHKIRMIMMLKLAVCGSDCVCVAESVFYEQIKIAIISEN